MKVRVKKCPKAQYGLRPDIEAESGEQVQYTDGSIEQLPKGEEYKHEQGGVIVSDVNKVLENTSSIRNDDDSINLKLTRDAVKDITGVKPKKALSHSEALEFAAEVWDRRLKSLEKKLSSNIDYINKTNSIFAKNSMEENLKLLDSIPTKADLFESLFNHQESIKREFGIKGGGKARNGYDGKRYDDYVTSLGEQDKTINKDNIEWKGRQAKNKNGFYGSADEESFKADHQWFFNAHPDYSMSNPDHVREFQTAYNNKFFEEFGRPYFEGNGYKAIDGKFGNYTSGAPLLIYKENYTYPKGSPDTGKYEKYSSTEPVVYRGFGTPVGTDQEVTERTQTKTPNGKERFNVPLSWYDVASALDNLINSDRIPVRHDSVRLQSSPPKYLDPRPSLSAANESYRQALDILPDNAVGYANLANLFSTKYKMDNQVLGNYENSNNQIYNTDRLYQDSIANQQEQLDMQSRQVTESKYLQSLEKQRQQKAMAFGDLMDTLAKNKKFNREGNLIMSMIDFYNQRGDYNGLKYDFVNPKSTLGETQVISKDIIKKDGRFYRVDNKTKTLIPLN